MTGLVL